VNNAVALDWAIYADDNGAPAGIPNDPGTASPVWSHTAAPGDPGVTISDNNITLDLITAGEPEIDLSTGTYWLVFYPTIEFGTDFNNRWNWSQGVPALNAAHLVDPNNLFGAGATDWTPQTAIGVGWPDTAFTLSGTIDCDSTPPSWLSLDLTSGTVPGGDAQTINVTFDADGLAPDVYEASLCITSNDPDNPLLFIPVSFEVVGEGTLPEISLNPEEFNFNVPLGGADDDTLNIANVGGGAALDWSIETANSPAGNRGVDDFDGDFDIANWTLVNSPSGVNGSFSTESGPPIELYVLGGDDGVGGFTDFEIEVPADGEISFSWGYQSIDIDDFDGGGYAINGAYTELANNANQVPFFNETASVSVSAGDTFAFRVRTDDDCSVPVSLASPISVSLPRRAPPAATSPVLSAGLRLRRPPERQTLAWMTMSSSRLTPTGLPQAPMRPCSASPATIRQTP
jgi:hypothetical protein